MYHEMVRLEIEQNFSQNPVNNKSLWRDSYELETLSFIK
jgi:hypothetical protein